MTDKELQEQAYELAEYIHKHPANYTALYYRVRWLAHPSDDRKIDALVEAVEGWLEKFREPTGVWPDWGDSPRGFDGPGGAE